MSKCRKFSAALLAAVFAAVSLFADEEYVYNYTWTYEIIGDGAEITGIDPKPTDHLKIPAYLGGKPVVSFGDGAFCRASGLTGVTIPGSVTNIGYGAFAYDGELASVSIPNGVQSIGPLAFYWCDGMKSLELPDSVTSIGNRAFFGCPGLADSEGFIIVRDTLYGYHGDGGYVEVPNSVRVIDGGGVFDLRRNQITAVRVPASVKTIGDSTFYGCSHLMNVWLPDRFEGKLDESVFSGCPETMKIEYYAIPCYWIRFHRNNGTDESAERKFYVGEKTRLPSLKNGLGWARRGYDFKGWATSEANAAAGKVWKQDWSYVLSACEDGKTLDVYAVWALSSDGYEIQFFSNDGLGLARTLGFVYGSSASLPSAGAFGWAQNGFDFKGWATSEANAKAGKVWKAAGAAVTKATNPGSRLNVYAVWALKPGHYAITFIRNDGAGTYRTIGFPYGENTRLPTLAKGLGWARRGYDFNGWSLSAADANNGRIWKGDWANVAMPVAAGNTLTVYASWVLKQGFYQIRYNKNDGTGKWRTLGFECGVTAKVNTIAGLGWTRAGHPFKGWGSNKANADAGKVWKRDGAWVKDATAEGKTLSIYAIWE